MSLLITRPRYDAATHYLYHWSKLLITEAERQRIDIYDIQKKDVTRKKVESYLKKNRPEIVILNGHGSSTTVVGHNNEEIIIANKNSNLLKGKKVFIIACNAGKELGPSLINAGAEGFVGYNEPFVFFHTKENFNNPLNDAAAAPVLECSNQVGISLIKGHSVEEANRYSLKTYSRAITKMLTSESSGTEYLWTLLWNRKCQVCYASNKQN